MKQGLWGFVAGVVVAVLVFGLVTRGQDAAFERRAKAAEGIVKAQRAVLEIQQAQIAKLSIAVAHRNTVIRYREAQVAAVDSIHPPAGTCLPNLATRDSLIADQRAQIADLAADTLAQSRALAALRISDTAQSHSLKSRPSRAPFRLTLEGGLGPSWDVDELLHLRRPRLTVQLTLVRFRIL